MDIFDRVKELAKNKGTTIECVLNSAGGIPLNTYNGWRKRKILPRGDECLAIAHELGVSVEYLLTGEDAPSYQCKEAQAVEKSPELQALVRAIMRDPNLLRVISAVVTSSEKNIGLA